METNPLILLPNPQTLFQRRADRFRQLAQTQVSLTGYLQLMAGLADIQHRLAGRFIQLPMPDLSGSTPPLAVSAWPRDPAWRAALRTIAERINPGADPLAALCGRILAAADAEIETWAEGLLAGELASLDPALRLSWPPPCKPTRRLWRHGWTRAKSARRKPEVCVRSAVHCRLPAYCKPALGCRACATCAAAGVPRNGTAPASSASTAVPAGRWRMWASPGLAQPSTPRSATRAKPMSSG